MARILLFVGLIAAGYGIYINWDTINEKIGLGEVSPEALRAIRIAKQGYEVDNARTNDEAITDRMRQLGSRVKVEGWKAEPKAGAKYLVTFAFELDDEPDGYYFEVDVGSLKVRDARADADLRERYGLPAPPE